VQGQQSRIEEAQCERHYCRGPCGCSVHGGRSRSDRGQTAALSWRARLGRREEAAAIACSRATVLLGRRRRNLLERHRPAREPLPPPAHAPRQPARASRCCAARAPPSPCSRTASSVVSFTRAGTGGKRAYVAVNANGAWSKPFHLGQNSPAPCPDAKSERF